MNEWFEAERRVERAQQLSESQRFEEALAELDYAVAINPYNAAWHAQRGYLLEELDRWDESATAYEAALELEPEDPEIAVALGAALSRLGRYARALEILNDVARRHPDFEPAYCHRVGIYAELGQHDQAEEVFYLAQELNDACPHCFFFVGNSLFARGQYDRAVYCWRRVLELEPDYIGVNQRIAQAFRAQGRLDEAKEHYLREVREDPGNADLLYELAELAVESGELATAAARLVQILELDPQHAESRFALGKICLLRGQLEQAAACFESIESSLGTRPDLPGFHLRYGETLFRLGRYAEARRRLQLATRDEGARADVLMLLGDCLLALGKPSEAGDAYRRLLALNAANPLAQHKLAICLIQQGSFTAAISHCHEAIRLKPDYIAAMLTAVIANARCGRWRDARRMLGRAMRLDPSNRALQKLARQLRGLRLRHWLRRLAGWFVERSDGRTA